MENNKNNIGYEGIDEERSDPLLDDYQEETATEITEPVVGTDDMEDDMQSDDTITNVYGWVAVALSVISFFIIPILFAAAGIVVGFIARNKAAPILGNTAIVIGIISLIVRFLMMPLM